MTRIVTTHYRYKRPPRKRKAIALEVPAIVAIPDKKQSRVLSQIDTSDAGKTAPAAPPANDDRRSAIVTVRRKGRADVPDMTPEEYQRRGDAADALFQEMKRRIAEKDRQ